MTTRRHCLKAFGAALGAQRLPAQVPPKPTHQARDARALPRPRHRRAEPGRNHLRPVSTRAHPADDPQGNGGANHTTVAPTPGASSSDQATSVESAESRGPTARDVIAEVVREIIAGLNSAA